MKKEAEVLVDLVERVKQKILNLPPIDSDDYPDEVRDLAEELIQLIQGSQADNIGLSKKTSEANKVALGLSNKLASSEMELQRKISKSQPDNSELMDIIQAVAHVGVDWGYGEYVILPTDSTVGKARKIIEALGDK